MTNTNLPLFPVFSPLEAHHQAELMAIVNANHLYSDYNFISLWSWDHQRRLQVSLLNDNLVIRFQDYLDPADYFYSFLGTVKVDDTARQLLQHSLHEGKPVLKLIPQFVVEHLQEPQQFHITEDRDSFDYIIAVGDTLDLKGYSESKKRAFNKLHREHGQKLSVAELDIGPQATVDQIMALCDRWAEQTDATDFKDNERRAIQKLLDSRNELDTANLHIIGLFMDGALHGFSINEVLHSGFAMGHFKKASRDYKGLGVALDHYTAKSLADKGVTHINHEQDLGIEGLRQSKMASNPVYFLKKYDISLAQ